MANFGSTQAVDFGGGSKTLVRINQDQYSSEYYLRESLQELTMKIRHTKTSPKDGSLAADRHNVEITQTVFAVANTTPEYTRKAYFVFEAPAQYMSVLPTAGLFAWAVATSNEALTNLSGWQS
jgi:hypothetical protein